MSGETPHADRTPATAGVPLDEADAAVIALHGRGATAGSVLQVVSQLDVDGVAAIAPQAARNTWYPAGFMEPIEENEPWLSAALEAVTDVRDAVDEAGIPAERTVLLGFSQGARLASEFVAQNARRYGGLVAFSGGLIGPPGTPRDYEGDLDGTPVFLGCSDRDPHVPEDRVHETAEVLEGLGADVTKRLYPGMGHTIKRGRASGGPRDRRVGRLVHFGVGGSDDRGAPEVPSPDGPATPQDRWALRSRRLPCACSSASTSRTRSPEASPRSRSRFGRPTG